MNLEALAEDNLLPEAEEIKEVGEQTYSCLMALCTGEAFDVIVGVDKGRGLETWTRLHHR